MTGYLVGRDAVLTFAPLDAEAARDTLAMLLASWREGMLQPLPAPCKTALHLCQEGDNGLAAAYEGGHQISGEASQEPCLARLWPDFLALEAAPQWRARAQALYQPLAEWCVTSVEIGLYAGDDAKGEAA